MPEINICVDFGGHNPPFFRIQGYPGSSPPTHPFGVVDPNIFFILEIRDAGFPLFISDPKDPVFIYPCRHRGGGWVQTILRFRVVATLISATGSVANDGT